MADLVLYDGTCGLCSGLVQFILRRDGHDRFRFAPLQGAAASRLLLRHGRAPTLDTVYVLRNYGQPDETLLAKAEAVFQIAQRLGGVWRVVFFARLLPDTWTEALYDWVARRRYGWFGRAESCLVPEARDRAKFI